MTDKAKLRTLGKALGEGMKLMLPDDVAFALVLGVKGTGEHICVSNIPATETRQWLANAANAEAQEGKL
jgi:hypothetical protein